MDEILAELADGRFVIQQVRTKSSGEWCDYYTIRTEGEARIAAEQCNSKQYKFRIVRERDNEVLYVV